MICQGCNPSDKSNGYCPECIRKSIGAGHAAVDGTRDDIADALIGLEATGAANSSTALYCELIRQHGAWVREHRYVMPGQVREDPVWRTLYRLVHDYWDRADEGYERVNEVRRDLRTYLESVCEHSLAQNLHALVTAELMSNDCAICCVCDRIETGMQISAHGGCCSPRCMRLSGAGTYTRGPDETDAELRDRILRNHQEVPTPTRDDVMTGFERLLRTHTDGIAPCGRDIVAMSAIYATTGQISPDMLRDICDSLT